MRKTALRARPKPKEYDLDLAEIWWAYTIREGRCDVCGARRGLQAHHVLGKTHIEGFCVELGCSNEERNALLWDEDNGLSVCLSCHEKHTNGSSRIPFHRLPERALRFARMLGAMAQRRGKEWAMVRLEREYPGASP